MNDSGISMNELLTRMRTLVAEAENRPTQDTSNTNGSDFSALLKHSIDQVNAAKQNASRLGEAFEVGDPTVNLAEVMVALQKSSLSFQAMTQVRNKMVAAYQEIMSMQV